ncbi:MULTISPECIES: DODA-type extradiol aromatic ring-opening family dioxygenase [Silvimonas]|uniref:DODA-type extradiol aromatic ring-opening family dioxygenase n=1 Tax=Silvimonas TaxID=300264 RepID=UPI0024B37BED|nr:MULTISPECIES: class III extradiol ring-cleavage dioxygenase [Silvimonas]MDR3430081.1 class III extradiol ring-cleavage dioxygenase [Silvimonas sp.]
MTRLPTLFVSHGSPMLALDAGKTGEAWARVAASLPRPRAILMVSAHWHHENSGVTTAAELDTIHDFYGFPAPLYDQQYPVPGVPELAKEIADEFGALGLQVMLDPQRGLDHGAWVPLKSMYPQGDIPVVQMALDLRRDTDWHYAVGRALNKLRDEGILIIGSGSITHNLRDIIPGVSEGPQIPAYVPAFMDWMHQHIVAKDVTALLDYRQQSPGGVRAHPSQDHILPLYVAMGAADGETAVREYTAVTEGVLGMDIYRFGEIPA